LAPLVLSIERDNASIAQSARLLDDYDRLQAELPTLEKRLKEIHTSNIGTTGFLEGATPALVAAKLQADVQQIANAAQVAVRSSQTVPPAKEAGLRRIGLQLELGATPAGLQQLLHRIGMSTPALFVERLTVRLPEDGTVLAAPDGQPQLTVHLELCGYQREAAP
jgi:Type II secretion system (T2SS), protein M subtype b